MRAPRDLRGSRAGGAAAAAMQEIIASVDHIKFDLEIAVEQQLGAQPLPFPGMDSERGPGAGGRGARPTRTQDPPSLPGLSPPGSGTPYPWDRDLLSFGPRTPSSGLRDAFPLESGLPPLRSRASFPPDSGIPFFLHSDSGAPFPRITEPLGSCKAVFGTAGPCPPVQRVLE